MVSSRSWSGGASALSLSSRRRRNLPGSLISFESFAQRNPHRQQGVLGGLQSPEFGAILLDRFGTLIPAGSQTARRGNLKEVTRILKVDPDGFARSWMESFDQRGRGESGPLERTRHRLAAVQGVHPSLGAVQRAANVRMESARELLDSSTPALSALDALHGAGVRPKRKFG